MDGLKDILWLFNTCGWIVAPAMWLAGIVAIVLCARAMRQPTPERRRLAFQASFVPFAIGIAGVFLGLAFCAINQTPADPGALLKVCLAGFVVTLPALVWSLLLVRSRPQPA